MDDRIEEEALDRQLREALPYIEDGGFTARVLQRLPPPRSARSLRAIILLGSAIAAGILGYVFSDNGRFINVAIERLASLPMLSLAAFVLTSGILVSAFGLVVALTNSQEG
jgi:hypothetical protein